MTALASPAVADTTVRISVENSGLALSVQDDSLAPGARIEVRPYSGLFRQQWIMKQVASSGTKVTFVYSRKVAPNLCLAVEGNASFSGARLVQQSCSASNPFQQWERDFSVNATFLEMKNKGSGLLTTADGTFNGAPVTQRFDVSARNQRWSVLGA
ncbi:RICIN domain-containing protein [Nonomuraea sp. NPDC050547]|uniref:RICIN domain-containing protein n=1 Tax=Nonomuraea sp. NPDC050547 TaxID=3364368 RepID=UPI0037A55274